LPKQPASTSAVGKLKEQLKQLVPSWRQPTSHAIIEGLKMPEKKKFSVTAVSAEQLDRVYDALVRVKHRSCTEFVERRRQ